MKTIELSEATKPLAEYARRARREVLVIMQRGRPVLALTPLDSRTDLENLTVTSDPEFHALIERSRRLYPAGTGLTTEEVRAHPGVRRRSRRRK